MKISELNYIAHTKIRKKSANFMIKAILIDIKNEITLILLYSSNPQSHID